MADDISLIIGVDDRDLIRTQKEQKKFERNLLIIEAAMRKGDISSKRYSAELNKQAKQLSRLGGTYAKANSEVRTYATNIRKLTDDQFRLAMANNAAGKSTNKFGMYAQQVGYQVGDFFVQVQSGTSALVAFGQQGTQLAGLLPGVYGAVIGISLAIGTMLLRSFMDASGSSKTFSKALEDTESAIKSYLQLIENAAEGTRALTERFGGFTDSIKGVLIDLKELGRQDAIKNFEQQIDNLSIVSLGFKGTLVKITGGVHGAATATKFFAKELGLTLEQFTSISKLSDATKTGPIEDRVEAALKLRDSILEVTGGTKNMTKKMSEYFSSLLKSVEAGAELTAILDGTGAEAEKLNELEKQRLDYVKLYYDYQERDLKIQRDLNAAVKAIVEKRKELARDAKAQSSDLERQIRMATAILASGEKSLRVKNLEKTQRKEVFVEELKSYELELERLGHSKTVIEGLVKQKEAAFGLKTELQEAAEASTEIAKLAAMTDQQYQKFIDGQAYAASRLSAPKEPVKHAKPKKEPKVKETDIERFQKQLDLERELLYVSSARKKVLQVLGSDIVAKNPEIVASMEAQIRKTQELIDLEEKRKSVVDLVTGSVENGLMAMVDGTKSVSDAFKSMASEIIKELYRIYVVKQITNAISSAMSFNPFSFDGGGYTGSGPRSGGLDGRGGFMAMMHPQETVVDHTKGQSAGGDNVVINQSFSFQANGDDSVKKIIAQAAPQIAQMTKNSMLNDRRRGGTTKAVFG